MRYIAFLRAINVGGHIVKMERLMQLFQSLGLAEVETFIASGNIIFDANAKSVPALEQKIEKHLEKELGYEVKTFVRTLSEVSNIAAFVPFGAGSQPTASTLFIGFLKAAPDDNVQERLKIAQTAVDEFRIVRRELYWRCRGASHESSFSGPKLEKMLGLATTLRNANTVRRLAEKYRR